MAGLAKTNFAYGKCSNVLMTWTGFKLLTPNFADGTFAILPKMIDRNISSFFGENSGKKIPKNQIKTEFLFFRLRCFRSDYSFAEMKVEVKVDQFNRF